MSDDHKPLVPEIVTELDTVKADLGEKELKAIQEYVDEGRPGIHKVDEQKLAKMFDLYLSGYSYTKISNITRTEKRAVMYLSQKQGWCEKRREYLIELEENMKQRVIEAKLVSQDFMIQLVQMWQKKISKKMAKYLSTDNEEHLDAINLKEIDRYLKVVDALKESLAPPKTDKGPAVGLNLGDGVTITKKSENEVEITPKQKAIGDILEQYANARREEEKKK